MGVLASGALSTLNTAVTVDQLDNNGSIGFIISGTWVGTVTFQGSLDGSTYVNMQALSLAGGFVSYTVANGSFVMDTSGLKAIRAKVTSYTSGTINIEMRLGSSTPLTSAITTLIGSTDSTKIGNVGDALKVSAAFTGSSIATAAAFTSKTRVVVLTTTVPLASGSYTTVYSYSGSGLLYGFNAEFNNSGIIIRLQIDGETIFEAVTIGILNSLLATANDAARRQAGTGIVTSGNTLDWSLKQPIKYNSSIIISADAGGGGLFTRSFNQGIVYLSKET